MRFLPALALLAALITPAYAMSETIQGQSGGYGDLVVMLGGIISIASMLIHAPFYRAAVALAIFALCVALSGAALAGSDGTEPDPVLTPGEIRSSDRDAICSHRTGEFRRVTVTEKIASRRAYGIIGEFGGYCGNVDTDGKRGCEQDHRVPLVVGGGNSPGSIRNIWAQRPDGPFGYHVKDKCEDRVGRALCAGKISVSDAQAVFLGDWRKNCRPWVPELPDVE